MTCGRQVSRRSFLAATSGVALAGAVSRRGGAVAAPREVRAEPVASGFISPVDVAIPPNRPNRLLVADQPGIIYRVDDGAVVGNPFLDLRESIVDVSGYSERGLLGIALHPAYASNRRIYVRYSAPPRNGTPDNYAHTFVLSEFTATADGTGVVSGSERTLLEIPEPQANHNGGSLTFGPDGNLYIGVGDGGAAADQGPGHVSDWYDAIDGGNGQDVTANLLGSILRINPDDRSGDLPYGIPADNPLVDAPGYDEHYAWGFRNPWRFSFDGSDFYVADVGQNQYEEVNLVTNGGNYGWNVREGTHCFQATSCPAETPSGAPLRDPIIEYTHADDTDPGGQSVIGGYRYRGTALDPLTGAYVFTDWQCNGRLFVASPRADGLWPITVHPLRGIQQPVGQYALAFGRTPADELLLLTTDEAGVTGRSGRIHRLTDVAAESTTSTTPTTTATTTSAATTTTDGQSGFSLLAALIGAGAATAYGLHRLQTTDSEA